MSEERKPNKMALETQFIMADDEQAIHVAKIISSRKRSFAPHRRNIVNETTANICYLVGYQNIEINGDVIAPAPKRRITDEVVNVILPAVQNDVATATASPAIYDVVPAGTDDDDRATAIAGDKILKVLQRKIGRDFKRGEAVLWWDISTIGWRKVYWDANDTVIGINPDPMNEDGSQNIAHNPNIPVGEALMQGEVQIECIPTNQLIYDYRETNLNKLKWIIHAKRVTSNWVVDRFGTEIHDKLKSQFISTSENGESEFEVGLTRQFNNLVNGFTGNKTTFVPKMDVSSHMQLESDEFIDYYEYWEKPSKSMPTGVYAVMLGTQVVMHAPYPSDMYPHGELPFIPAAPMNITGVSNGSISRISQARPLQRKLNELASQIDENIDIMGNAIIMAPKSAKLRHRSLDNGAGNIIEYDGPVGKPTREPGVPMNSQVFSYLNDKKLAIDSLFAFHHASQGIAPRNIESGKGLERLANADTRQLGPIVEAFEEADQRVAYQALTLALKNYENDRLVNVVGTDYDWTIFKIDRQQLQGKMNVIVRRHSSMPIDKEAEKIQAFQAWQSGVLGDPQDPVLRTWTLEQMNMGNATVLMQKHSKQKNFAAKEFLAAEENLKDVNLPEGATPEQVAQILEQYLFIPQVNNFDDHSVHIQVHSEYLLSNFWKAKSTGNALFIELINRMNIHIGQHQMVIQQRAEAAYQRDLEREMLIKGKTPQQIALSKMDLSGKNTDNKDKKGK